jgi:hypothetical protein
VAEWRSSLPAARAWARRRGTRPRATVRPLPRWLLFALVFTGGSSLLATSSHGLPAPAGGPEREPHAAARAAPAAELQTDPGSDPSQGTAPPGELTVGDAKREVERTARELAAWEASIGSSDPVQFLADLDAQLVDLRLERTRPAEPARQTELDFEIASVQQQRFEVASYLTRHDQLTAAHEAALADLDAAMARAPASTAAVPGAATRPGSEPSSGRTWVVVSEPSSGRTWVVVAVGWVVVLGVVGVGVHLRRRRDLDLGYIGPARSAGATPRFRQRTVLQEAPVRDHPPRTEPHRQLAAPQGAHARRSHDRRNKRKEFP